MLILWEVVACAVLHPSFSIQRVSGSSSMVPEGKTHLSVRYISDDAALMKQCFPTSLLGFSKNGLEPDVLNDAESFHLG